MCMYDCSVVAQAVFMQHRVTPMFARLSSLTKPSVQSLALMAQWSNRSSRTLALMLSYVFLLLYCLSVVTVKWPAFRVMYMLLVCAVDAVQSGIVRGNSLLCTCLECGLNACWDEKATLDTVFVFFCNISQLKFPFFVTFFVAEVYKIWWMIYLLLWMTVLNVVIKLTLTKCIFTDTQSQMYMWIMIWSVLFHRMIIAECSWIVTFWSESRLCV